MDNIPRVHVCRGCQKVKKFHEWIPQSQELINEIREGRIKIRHDICDKCRPK